MISVVATAYNEQDNIEEFITRVTDVLGSMDQDYELIIVDDGSIDRTSQIVRQQALINQRIRLIVLSRNFGQHSAVAAGMRHAVGDMVVWMDADLQDIPEEMPKLIEELQRGYDIVYGIRDRRADSFTKRLNARLFFGLFRWATGFNIPVDISTYRVLSRKAVDAFNSMNEHSRFTAGMMAWLGFSVSSVPIRHGERKGGQTKYGLLKLITLSLDAFFSFSSYPIRFASHFGLLLALLSFCFGIYMLIKKLTTGFIISGYASLIVSMFFLAGLQFFFMGLMGEYIARIFKDVQGRPLYVIKDTLNIERRIQE